MIDINRFLSLKIYTNINMNKMIRISISIDSNNPQLAYSFKPNVYFMINIDKYPIKMCNI